jgi:hypothetical protein
MIHLTLFGGTDAEIAPGTFTAFTMFGGAELKRPTLAQRIMQRRREKGRKLGFRERWFGRDRSLVITIFGGTDILAPTIMEEYAALRNLVQSGVLSKAECRDLIQEIASGDDERGEISRITFCGGCGFESPKPKIEHRALDAAESARIINAQTRRELEKAIGCPSNTAASVVAAVALA